MSWQCIGSVYVGELRNFFRNIPPCLHTALPWFTDLGSKAADMLLSTRNPHTVNKSALEEAAQKVTVLSNQLLPLTHMLYICKVNADIWELRRTVLLARVCIYVNIAVPNACNHDNLVCRESGKEMLTVSSKPQEWCPPSPCPKRVPSQLVVTSSVTTHTGGGNSLISLSLSLSPPLSLSLTHFR